VRGLDIRPAAAYREMTRTPPEAVMKRGSPTYGGQDSLWVVVAEGVPSVLLRTWFGPGETRMTSREVVDGFVGRLRGCTRDGTIHSDGYTLCYKGRPIAFWKHRVCYVVPAWRGPADPVSVSLRAQVKARLGREE
jgi:hypothetical protein